MNVGERRREKRADEGEWRLERKTEELREREEEK